MMKHFKPYLSIFVSVSLFFAPLMLEACGSKTSAENAQSSQSAGQAQSQTASTQQSQQAPATTQANPTPDELYQLVAPIALFPDNLVALVLTGSTYPDQVTAANTWLSQNSSLKGDALNQAVDKQPWDNSIKGLTGFPDVLTQMATNLSWTSALGDAYYNIPQDVMNAVQVMRQRAQQAGNLKTNEQQKVSTQQTPPPAAPAAAAPPQTVIVQAPPQTIIIQPAQPTVVYVPTYNPTVVYGAPVPVYPGYSTSAMVATGIISFGIGIAVGAAIANNNHCCGWGYSSWGCGWHNSTVIYNRNVYVSHSTTFVNRGGYYGHGGGYYNHNNVNINNVNVNNVNRNNINTNNVNRNNVNTNNVNRNHTNNNYRTNNFTTPTFNQSHNQPQYNNNRGATQNNRQSTARQHGATQQNRGGQNQARSGNAGQSQREPSRGYGQERAPGTSKSAFSNYGHGGNTRTNSERGGQSLQGNHGSSRPQSRPAPSSHGGGGGGGRRR